MTNHGLAFAAHELRGEISLQLAVAEAALADPGAGAVALREMGEQVIAGCERQERLLEAVLTLARSECAPLRREPVDLAATAASVLRAQGSHALTSATVLRRTPTTGDPQLVERLLANLIGNAIRHNVPGGRLDVGTYTTPGRAIVRVANTGPVVPAGEIAGLFRPFHRLGRSADGVGLGLAIVRAIADAHDATVSAHARTGGGLDIAVAFPLTTERTRRPCAAAVN